MISKVLSKETCKNCKFCCVFKKESLWELPTFTNAEFILNNSDCFENGQLKMEDLELASCPFLDNQKGCTLSDDEKPLECKIWPLRVMKKDGKLVLVFETICPELGEKPPLELIKLVENEIGDEIKEYVKKYPFIAKDYKNDFPIIIELE